MAEVKASDGSSTPVSLSVLELTTEARNMHGLRHQDYQRYRQFCARKIRRSRAAVGLQQGKRKFEKKDVEPELVKDEKHLHILLFQAERCWSYAMELKSESAEEPRKKHHLIQKLRRAAQAANELQTVSANVVDARTMLELQAYAESMEGFVHFEQQKWSEALEKFGAARTIYERLAKAAATPQQETLCQSAVDALDPNIRYCAYNLKLKGGQTLDVGALIEMQSRAGSLGLLSSKVESILAQASAERAAQVQSISWRGKSVPTKSHTLVESIFQAQQLGDVLDRTTAEVPVQKVLEKAVEPEDGSKADWKAVEERMELFDKVLGAWWDATKIIEADLKEDAIATAKVKSSKSEENTANLQFLFSYVSYRRLMKTIERNLVLVDATLQRLRQRTSTATSVSSKPVSGTSATKRSDGSSIFGKKPKPEDIVKLYDAIVQSVNEAKELSAIQTDLILQSILVSELSFIKAKRTTYIAQLYSSTGNSRASVALFDRAIEHLTASRAELETAQVGIQNIQKKKGKGDYDSEDAETVKKLADDLSDLESRIRGGQVAEKARKVLEAADGVESITSGVEQLGLEGGTFVEPPLIDRLSSFVPTIDPQNPNLVAFPPQLRPVGCKPLSFDVGFSYLDFPTANLKQLSSGKERTEWAVNATEEDGSSKRQEDAKGGKGFFSSWFGSR
ncbi:hypothetical protein BJ742DRAFT_809857 [Cladochytrium replicatum]|nr:hypothetical protein BJ742DRAFT_809857 [Cladochytrium replicatum]